jgi:eukaryotic-like serine/threonine-protein kinase
VNASLSPAPPDIPDFDLIRLIGEGGFGVVWLASNRTTGRLRAVKLIPLERSGAGSPASRELVSLVHLEARVGENRPGLLAIHHVGRTAEHLFYVMAPADDATGSPASRDPAYQPATLQRRLEAGPLGAEECLDLARQLLVGLAALHAAGMVHRDVKPANCLFVGGQLKLADFGLLTEAGPSVSRLGTRRYMPPDGRMDTRADIYAAGLVIYQMLSGQGPESFPRLGPRTAEIAGDALLQRLNRLALRAAQPHPARRFQDAAEMLAELDAAEPWRRRSARRLGAGLAGVALAALAVAAVWVWPHRGLDSAGAGPLAVEVNFLTEPYANASIYLDGRPLLDADEKPLLTPCTAGDVPSGEHRVEFRHPSHGTLDAGQIDFSAVREVEARWPSAANDGE